MLSIITGKQRAGKTYFCVSEIQKYLKYQKRNIYTNLPLNPQYLCDITANGLTKNQQRYQNFLRRIHLFKKFHSYSELRKFFKENKDFCLIRNHIDRSLIQPEKNIEDFWNHISPNSVVLLDEVYQWFSSALYSEANVKERRKQLLTYSRQHGHFKDDIILISHNENDLDIHIRRGCMYKYVVQNAKYKNIFEWRWVRGLKWPVQFFFIYGFEFGEKEPSDTYTMWPDKRIFKCYNSFSAAESLAKRTANIEAESTDTGVNFWWNLRNFLSQGYIGLIVIVGFISFLYFGYEGLQELKNIGRSKPDDVKLSKKEVKVNSKTNVSTDKQITVNEVNYVKPTILSVSSSALVWSDGFKLEKGQIYKGLKVSGFTKDYVVFTFRHKSYTVPHDGARIYPKNPVVEKSGESVQSTGQGVNIEKSKVLSQSKRSSFVAGGSTNSSILRR